MVKYVGMVERYEELEPFLLRCLEAIKSNRDYYLHPKKNIEIQEIFGLLRAFQAKTESLQDESTNLTGVKYMFDKFLWKYFILIELMSQNLQIVHSPKFESALVKTQEEA